MPVCCMSRTSQVRCRTVKEMPPPPRWSSIVPTLCPFQIQSRWSHEASLLRWSCCGSKTYRLLVVSMMAFV
eukprot:994609-Amphidinium_carterae.2